jgi:hypothetical protein
MMRRGITLLALAEIACFLLLSRLDFAFSLFHIYESLIYAAIAVLLIYSESRWAYMLGILAPSVWMLLAVATGAFGEPMREITRLIHVEPPNYAVQILGGAVSMLSVAMIALCAYRWEHQFAKAEKRLRTFAVSLGIVTAYYGVLALWFWRSAIAAQQG